jgi:hypothetical protein
MAGVRRVIEPDSVAGSEGCTVSITSAQVRTHEGRLAATIDLVEIGGGSQTVTVDGVPEQRVHPSRQAFHVRLIAPDRMIPDDLRESDTFEQAVKIAATYAGKLTEHADRLAALTDDLKV